jgi:amiloride-sensitive sodium channel
LKLVNFTKLVNLQKFVKNLEKCSPNLVETFLGCSYGGQVNPCEKVMTRVITYKGICYSFNMFGINQIFNSKIISKDFESYRRKNITKSLDPKDPLSNVKFDDDQDAPEWSLEGGYKSDSASFPLRARFSFYKTFYFVIDQEDFPNFCFFRSKSYLFYLHLPNEILTPFHAINHLKIDNTQINYLSATLKTTDESLRSYTPEQRRCYFEGERKLKFFASYTKAQCELECLTNNTLKECGCVQFFMPREENTEICNIENFVKCARVANSKFTDNIGSCGCLEPCTDIEYKIVNSYNSDFDYVSANFVVKLLKKFTDQG